MLKASIIVSVYKDTKALGLILKSLLNQTVNDFEIIISEDGNSKEMKQFMTQYSNHNSIIHLTQDDVGWRKNTALNRAVKQASNEYLIFIDGDIIPFSNFIEMHLKLASKNQILCGKRSELGKGFSTKLRNNALSAAILEKFYILFLPFLIFDKARHIEEGIKLKLNSFLEKILNSKKRIMLIGCNFSCFKSDLKKINGFDEDYITPSVGEDIDLMWRFKHFNIQLKSIRYLANVFHLWHPRNWGKEQRLKNDQIMNEKMGKKEFFCKNGLEKVEE